jgi:prepilin-type N-terminal cleavage/methylation domain-containing protein
MIPSRRNNNGQSGFTLIETLVSVAIIGLIAVALFAIIYQIFAIPAQNKTSLIAIKQVENAVHWLSRDAQQAQAVELDEETGFPVTLTWTDWDNLQYQITYTLVGGGLERVCSIDEDEPNIRIVARHINMDPSDTNCQYEEGTLSFKITATVTGFKQASETRSGEILLRAMQ